MKQILHIPNYTPHSDNELLSLHWSKRGKIKKADQELFSFYAMEQGISAPTTKRRISVRIVIPKGQRRMDKPNIKKVLFDSLTKAKVIKDDNPVWLEEGPIEYVRHDGELREVFVIVEDVN